jgi:HAD superfamily hydrolase (TIGR01458 family)
VGEAATEAVLLDLDGVLYVEDDALPGGQEAVARLRAAGFHLRYVTNTTVHSHSETIEKLRRLGFEVGADELRTPAALAAEHCRARGLERVSLLVGDELVDDFPGLDCDERAPQAVIVGDLGESFDYAVLNRAFRHILAGAELVALQKNRFWRRADGLSLDVGPFVAALEYATEQTAHVVGKPASGFFRGVLEGVGCAPEAAVMVGDDVETDVGGALEAGLRAVLVRTGKFRPEAVDAAGVTPTATLDSIVDLPAWLGA